MEEKKIPLPDKNTVLGIVEEMVGWAHAKVRCFDGKTRICRIPGKLQRRLWIREGDIVLVKPYEIQGDKKGDIIYRYNTQEIEYLKKKGYLKELEEEF